VTKVKKVNNLNKKPEALKSLYRSPGHKKNQLVLCKNYVNCPGMIIGRSSVFYADRKSKMAATTGHSINTGPYQENTEISSLKLLH
jgi:hypothetical protein